MVTQSKESGAEDETRTQAEVEKLRAEARQADAETRKIQRELNRPWFRGSLFLQAITAGLVAIPLIWFYVKEVAIPLYQAKNIKLERQIETSLFDLQKEKVSHAEAVKRLVEEKEESSRALLSKLNELRVRYESVEKTSENLKTQYQTLLATHELTNSGREKLKLEYDVLKKSLVSRADDISVIDAEIEAQKLENLSAGERFASVLREMGAFIDQGAATYRESIAVVVGVDSYESKQFNSLPGVVKDTQAVGKVLDGQGFRVITLVNPTHSKTQETLAEVIRNARPEDRVVIYWAGHGLVSSESGRQRGYLATADCNPDTAFQQCLPMETIPDVLERLGAKSALALVDASFAGLALANTRGVRLISEFTPRFSKEIIAASDSSGVVFDSSSVGLGPFAAGITEGLGEWKADFNNDGIIRTSELFQFLSSTIVQLTQGRQVPTYASLSPAAGEMLFSSSTDRASNSR